MGPEVSVVVCTHDRVPYLGKALASLRRQTLPAGAYEVLVVDNRSRDATRQLVERQRAGWASVRYVFEHRLGLSVARNTGWQAAAGQLVAYLDDDAIPAPDWLERIVEFFTTIGPTAGGVGGRILPIWEAPRPSWLSDGLLAYLTILDRSDGPAVLRPDQWIGGANMAFPRTMLARVGGFNARLGRRGRRLLSMEEVQLCRELERAGHPCLYAPGIVVEHHVPAEKLTKAWLLRRAFWQGVSQGIAVMPRGGPTARERLGLPAREIARLCARLAARHAARSSPGRDGWFARQCALVDRLGYLISVAVWPGGSAS